MFNDNSGQLHRAAGDPIADPIAAMTFEGEDRKWVDVRWEGEVASEDGKFNGISLEMGKIVGTCG